MELGEGSDCSVQYMYFSKVQWVCCHRVAQQILKSGKNLKAQLMNGDDIKVAYSSV